MNSPVGHHFKAASAYGIDNFGTFLDIGDLELLLKENRSLLVGRLYNARNKNVIRRRGRRMKERQEVDRLFQTLVSPWYIKDEDKCLPHESFATVETEKLVDA